MERLLNSAAFFELSAEPGLWLISIGNAKSAPEALVMSVLVLFGEVIWLLGLLARRFVYIRLQSNLVAHASAVFVNVLAIALLRAFAE